MQVEVSYPGEHNFDWDTLLEELAKMTRDSSDMDFETKTRTMTFKFDGESAEENANNFVAAVNRYFPTFSYKLTNTA